MGGCDCKAPTGAGAHPRTRLPPAQPEWPQRLPAPGKAQSAARGAGEAGGLLPRGRRAVLPPPLPPPLPRQPSCSGTREAAAPGPQPVCGRQNRGGGGGSAETTSPTERRRAAWPGRAELSACSRARGGHTAFSADPVSPSPGRRSPGASPPAPKARAAQP